MEKKYRKEPVEIPPEIAETAAGGKVPETDVTEQYPQMEEMNGTEAAGEMPQIGPMYPIPTGAGAADGTGPANGPNALYAADTTDGACSLLSVPASDALPDDADGLFIHVPSNVPDCTSGHASDNAGRASTGNSCPVCSGSLRKSILSTTFGSPCGYGSDMYDSEL